MRFILVDHSINGPGGHYLSYALSILDAAKLKGYETALITGAGFHPDTAIGHPYVRAYRYDFFGNRNVARETQNVLWSRLLFSIKHAWDMFIIWNAFVGPLPDVAKLIRKAVRVSLLILFIPQLFHLITGRSLREARALATSFASRLARSVATRAGRALRRTGDRSAEFAADTLSWLKERAANENDLILFPTISFQDCLGLGKAVRAHPEYQVCKWRLLFRRNLFPGDRQTYNNSTTRRYRPLFAELRRFSTFFTDSKELADQYRFAFEAEFHTLPIPHAKKHLTRESYRGPLCVSYIGDARTEKGFQLLPAIVEDCGRDPVLRKNVRFAIQSNYNIPNGEPLCVVAKSQLRLIDTMKVELLDRPLSQREYDDLLAQSDVGLLPYLRDNYYARTSGVVIEYLSAGIPVIVPSNTWLAAQFEQRVIAHQRALQRELKVLSRADVSVEPASAGKSDLHLSFDEDGDGFVSIDAASAPNSCFRLDVLVTFHSASRWRPVRRVVLCKSPAGEGSFRMLRIPEGVNRIDVKFRIFEDLPCISQLQVCTLLGKKASQSLSAVGLTYDSDSEIADCVRELTAHYAHYKASALSFAEEVNAYHDASSAVEYLLAPIKSKPG